MRIATATVLGEAVNFNVYLPDDLGEQAKAEELKLSRLLREAVENELHRRTTMREALQEPEVYEIEIGDDFLNPDAEDVHMRGTYLGRITGKLIHETNIVLVFLASDGRVIVYYGGEDARDDLRYVVLEAGATEKELVDFLHERMLDGPVTTSAFDFRAHLSDARRSAGDRPMSAGERATTRVSAITVRGVLQLPTGERLDALITGHIAERFIERVRWACDPRCAALELGRLLPTATVYERRPSGLRSSPISSDLYLRLGDWWMPAVRHGRDKNLIVIKTIFAPSDLRRQQTKARLDRKRRKERNAARRAAERAQRASRRRRNRHLTGR